ncbi:MAG: preprotein translocase subunit SecE [Cyanobacteria bacterium P01_A01_bin.3]
MAKGDNTERKDPARRGSSQANQPEEAKGPLGFFTNTFAELKKVAWPERQQLVSESSAVLLIVVAFASFIFLIDRLFGWLSGQVFG